MTNKAAAAAKADKAAEKATDNSKAGEDKDKPSEKKSGPNQILEEIRDNCRLIERGVMAKEPRFILRVLRGLFALRTQLTPAILRRLANGYYTHSAATKDQLLAFIQKGEEQQQKRQQQKEEPMETGESSSSSSAAASAPTPIRLRGAKSALTPLLPEIDSYLHLLVLLFLQDQTKGDELSPSDKSSPPDDILSSAKDCADLLMKTLTGQNRRSLDPIAARCFYYYARAYEAVGQMASIRGFLHARLRTTTLKNDCEGQAVLVNCLLRSYVNDNLYDQADKLVNKTTFPETASNNEWARYLYYLGRIKAIQLEYSESHKHLVQSLRKAPQSSAMGFRHTVLKLSITVELLLGDIPERQVFLQKDNKRPLAPYLQLTQAVRSGDVKRFQEVLDRHAQLFRRDHTYTLILRLHHNVIKTAIRTISLAYSRISLADVAQKLRLESSEDAEYIIAKAIRDGVIEAQLDHEKGWMQSRETTDIYATREPQLAFHQRIEFCLDLHNTSVKAMRFPPKSYNKDLESAEDRREREAQDLELAKELASEDEEDMM